MSNCPKTSFLASFFPILDATTFSHHSSFVVFNLEQFPAFVFLHNIDIFEEPRSEFDCFLPVRFRMCIFGRNALEVTCVLASAPHKKACDSSVSHIGDAKFDPLVKTLHDDFPLESRPPPSVNK